MEALFKHVRLNYKETKNQLKNLIKMKNSIQEKNNIISKNFDSSI